LQLYQALAGVFLLVQLIHFRRTDCLGQGCGEDGNDAGKPGRDGGYE
jgi:hypothetical protein